MQDFYLHHSVFFFTEVCENIPALPAGGKSAVLPAVRHFTLMCKTGLSGSCDVLAVDITRGGITEPQNQNQKLLWSETKRLNRNLSHFSYKTFLNISDITII